MPAPADPRRIVEGMVAAFSRHDRDGVFATLHDDIVCIGGTLPAAHGKQATIALLEPFFAAEAIDWQMLFIAADGRTVFTERIDRFRFTGKGWTAVRAAGVFEIADDGRIIAWRDYFDMAELAAAMPPAAT